MVAETASLTAQLRPRPRPAPEDAILAAQAAPPGAGVPPAEGVPWSRARPPPPPAGPASRALGANPSGARAAGAAAAAAAEEEPRAWPKGTPSSKRCHLTEPAAGEKAAPLPAQLDRTSLRARPQPPPGLTLHPPRMPVPPRRQPDAREARACPGPVV